ncbi:reverse transcriptase domain-containing protein [Tanacetum coccineum]|uniref:Reverse transcriptase domain-containing protein n=1 Tax=Tanacetum coccineum TaxID=301880 RepID=A0ABQ5CL66_9ASTR
MALPLFNRIVTKVTNHDAYFRNNIDCTKKEGISPLLKCTSAVRQLAYDVNADFLDEYLQMSNGSSRKHGFLEMLESLDCMDWEWFGCLYGFKWKYVRPDHGTNPFILVEAVASQDLCIWHAFFGVAGSNNDINPEFATLVKTIPEPANDDHKRILNKLKYESARKDVERAFGVLKKKLAILANLTRALKKERIINMILWFRWISFEYRVTLGFGSIAGGSDHVNPVIRLSLERGISRVLGLGIVFREPPYPFDYPVRRLTMEEILAKFIDEGRREHEVMEIFIKEFRTTNELLLKTQSNLLSEVKIKVNELSKVVSNVFIPKNEVKGVTIRGGKMTSEDTRSKEINETEINKNEPPRFEQDVQEKPRDDGVENKSLSIPEKDAHPLVKPQQSSIPFPNRKHKEAEDLSADHLSRFENPHIEVLTEREIVDKSFDDHLMMLKSKFNNDEPWYVDFVNYIVGKLNELAELRDSAYKNTRIYKERTKKWYDSRLHGDKDFKVGDKVRLYNSRLKMYPGKLKLKWSGPNILKTVYPHGAIEIIDRDGFSFEVNGQRLKKYYEGDIDKEDDEVIELENDATRS